MPAALTPSGTRATTARPDVVRRPCATSDSPASETVAVPEITSATTRPAVQYPAEPLKTETARTAVEAVLVARADALRTQGVVN